MTILTKVLKLPSYWAMIILFLALSLLFTYLFFISESNSKWATVFGGVAASFFVASTQFICQIYEYFKLKKYENMGVLDVLKERRDKDYYGNMIADSKREILVMGVTASRFFDDFANRSVQGNSQLIKAVQAGVMVKILLPKAKYLQAKDRGNFDELTLKLSRDPELDNKCKIKFFDHEPAHSLVLIDDACIVGPIFKGLGSKNTPAIVLKSDSVLAKPYIENFKREWEIADEGHE